MDVQTVFFTLGSVFMVLGIIVLLAVLIIAIIIQRKVSSLHKTVIKKLVDFDHVTIKPVRKIAGFVRMFVGK